MFLHKRPCAWQLQVKDWRGRTLASCKLKEDRYGMSIWNMCVGEAHRRKGHATKLVNQCKRDAWRANLRLWLRVDKSNTAAIALYEKCGFTKTTDIGSKEGKVYYQLTYRQQWKGD